MAYATLQDVKNRYHEDLDETLELLVTTRLADAELLLKNRIKDLDTQIDESTIDEAVVVMVEAEMVLRLIRNPEGYSQESDGNYSYAIYQQVASGRLEVLESEWELLGVVNTTGVLQPSLGWNVDPAVPIDPALAWQVHFPYNYAKVAEITGWWPGSWT
jgi:hypothetical protein